MLLLQKNQFPVVKIVFESREEAAPKQVLLQQWQLTVCKQLLKKKKNLGKQREIENQTTSFSQQRSHILSLSAYFLLLNYVSYFIAYGKEEKL